MSDFILSATSTVDINKEILDREDIRWIAFNYEIDGKNYKEDFGESISFNDFYEAMKDGAMTKTSQITYSSYIEYFENLLKEDKDILHLTLSSGITGEYNQALMAVDMLKEKYPERKIYVVDSLTATACQGLLVLYLNELRKSGFSIEEVYDLAKEKREYVHGWFFTSDLTYLVRGGRLSKAAGSFGNLLNICPLIEVNLEGKLLVRDKIRTKKKATKALIGQIKNHIAKDSSLPKVIFIVHTHLHEDAEELRETLSEKFEGYDIKIYEIGTTIGSHLGPGTLGASFWGDRKEI